MARFVTRRVLTSILMVFGASAVVFFIVFALPGDPLVGFGGGKPVDPAVRVMLEQKYHLDDPLPVQYVRWMGRVLRGEFGDSRVSRRPVGDIVGEALPNTVRLAAGAFLIEVAVGLAAGLLSALTKRPLLRGLLLASTGLLVAVPVFVLASAGQYLFGVRWGWLPVSGVADGFRSWILPSIVLALPSLALVIRLTEASMRPTGDTAYVELAMAKGVPPWRIMTHHRLRNGLVPVVTFLGLDLAALFGGALFVETVFNIPGLGLTTTRAVLQREPEIVLACSLLLIAVFIVSSLLVDVFVAWLDPRTRDE